MLVLTVATLGSYPIPSIFFNQLYDVSHLHGTTLILVFKTVNISPLNCIFMMVPSITSPPNWTNAENRFSILGIS